MKNRDRKNPNGNTNKTMPTVIIRRLQNIVVFSSIFDDRAVRISNNKNMNRAKVLLKEIIILGLA